MLTQLTQILQYREAARLLTLRELQVRYSNSVLGVIWSLLNPLAITAFFSIVFSVMLPSGVPAYPIFFLAALLPWNLFSLSLISGTQCIVANSSLVNRVYFPREILPVAVVLANGANYVIALIPLTVLMAVFGVPFTAQLLWLPVLVFVQIMFTIGLCLALSALNVMLRDVQQIVEVLMLPWFFVTPIIYTPEQITNPLARQATLILNPMAGLITNYRRVIYAGSPPDWPMLGVTLVEALIVLLAGALIFRRLSPHFVDEL